MLDFRQLGNSGLRVSSLALGTANFGWNVDAVTAHRLMDCALDNGVSFIDTADSYNLENGDGSSEAILGQWFSSRPARRRDTVLATKVYGATGNGANDRGLSARHIRLACEDSLRRLNTDWIDVYMLHHVDLTVKWEETARALEQLKAEGKILYVGTSNFSAWQMTGLHYIARASGIFEPVSEQSCYSLAQRSVELEVLPACRHFGIGFIAYSPLSEGFLGGPGTGIRRSRGPTAQRRQHESERLEGWYKDCAELAIEPSAAALAWVIAQPGLAAAVIGPRDEAQLLACISAAKLKLEDNVLAHISERWPGPGTAPEAYAW